MTAPIDVLHLEIHVAHACNLQCESCSHYSDQGHKGVVSLEDAEAWMSAWSSRIRPQTFSLVGGEPTLHPKLPDFMRLARSQWPGAVLRLVTNGFFLHKHPGLLDVLRGDEKAEIYLSLHHRSDEYLGAIQANHDLLQGWQRDYGIRAFRYDSFGDWRRTHHGSGASMLPYRDGRPRESWEHCKARYSPQLFDARVWKCAPLAYLGMQNARYGLAKDWEPYLAYRPLQPGCSDEALREFFGREQDPECGMCPARPERLALPMPLVRRAKRAS